MVGTFDVRVSRRRGVSFSFTVRRNITVVRGDSGTGKTTLFEMIADHTRLGDQSGVTIQCDRPCVALTDINWQSQLAGYSHSIVFIDEGFQELPTDEFARMVRGSSNYFVLITRADIPSLPYSVDEMYKIKTSGKYHTFEPIYKDRGSHLYSESRAKPKEDFDILLTEDSKSGFQFFEDRFEDSNLHVETAGTNSRIGAWLDEHRESKVFVIADGAAFGPYADVVLKIQNLRRDQLVVCLPESFEWLLLKSGIVHSAAIDRALADPSNHVDSEKHTSWEQYFTDLLKQETAGTPLAYHKSKLAKAYTSDANAAKVMALIACRNVH